VNFFKLLFYWHFHFFKYKHHLVHITQSATQEMVISFVDTVLLWGINEDNIYIPIKKLVHTLRQWQGEWEISSAVSKQVAGGGSLLHVGGMVGARAQKGHRFGYWHWITQSQITLCCSPERGQFSTRDPSIVSNLISYGGLKIWGHI